MSGQKGKKLQRIAPIGFAGLWRHPPLGGEMGQPAAKFVRDIRRQIGQIGCKCGAFGCGA
jgi:hypothetical protein